MSCPFTDAFRGRSVFVTGHTGFKGSWLCLWLEHMGASVTGYALSPPTEPNNFGVSRVQEGLTRHHEADVRDLETLGRAIDEARPELIFHLAAQSVVKQGYREPHETFEVNVMGTVNLLECVRRRGEPCAVVVVTSDKCYQNREQVWGYRESDAFGDHDPYGGSKGAAEIAVRAYRHSFFPPDDPHAHDIRLASARAGNVIGGGDWTADALIVDVVRALSQGTPVRLRHPDACRPWQHVLQALSGYLTLGAKLLGDEGPRLCGGWNIGPLPGSELPVREVVERFCEQWGGGTWEHVGDEPQPHEAHTLRLSIDKALWELGWKPGWTVEQALSSTADWYRRYHEGAEAMREVSLEQIAAYERGPLQTVRTS